jgi:[ribosomal protein S5]-alanine N-acetyltransferase
VPAPIPLRYPRPPLADGAIALRPWVAANLEALVAICHDPDVARFTPLPALYTDADGRAWLGGDLVRMQAGAELSLAIHERPDGPVGSIGVRVGDVDRDVAELGYLVARSARGRGVATQALRLVAEWVLREWRPARLQLTTSLDNAASQRVAERAGFRREGVLRSWSENKGRRVDLVMYSRLPGDP